MQQKQVKVNEKKYKKFFTISTIAFVILYPCLFMYFQNADEAKLIDALPAFENFGISDSSVCNLYYFHEEYW